MSATRHLPSQVLLLTAAMVPFVLALAAHAVGPKQREISSVTRPALTFDQYMVNLGPVEPRREHIGRFVFTNRGDRVVRITALEPSCGCLNPRLEKRVYQPGETGHFALRVQTANEEPGPKTYHCKVVYEDPEPRDVDVTFKVTLPEATVSVRPRSLILYSFGDGSVSKEIEITDTRAKNLKLVGVQSSLALVSATIGVSSHDDGQSVHRVLVEANNVPVGRHQALITVLTNDRDFPELRIPVWVERPDSVDLKQTASDDVSQRSQPR